MLYMRSLTFIFENPRWWFVLLMGIISAIIPIIGMIFFMGYLGKMLIDCHKSKKEALPNFDLNLLGDYLKVGIWPFLGMFLPSIVVGFVFIFMNFGFMGLTIAGKENPGMFIAMILTNLIYIPIFLAVHFVMVPCMIGGTLGQNFGATFNKEFILDFTKKMWVDVFLVFMFLFVVGMLSMLIGGLLCCVGAYVVFPLVMIMQWHLYWQLYEEYLKRGGQKIKINQN
jgi:hypothetical protein